MGCIGRLRAGYWLYVTIDVCACVFVHQSNRMFCTIPDVMWLAVKVTDGLGAMRTVYRCCKWALYNSCYRCYRLYGNKRYNNTHTSLASTRRAYHTRAMRTDASQYFAGRGHTVICFPRASLVNRVHQLCTYQYKYIHIYINILTCPSRRFSTRVIVVTSGSHTFARTIKIC